MLDACGNERTSDASQRSNQHTSNNTNTPSPYELINRMDRLDARPADGASVCYIICPRSRYQRDPDHRAPIVFTDLTVATSNRAEQSAHAGSFFTSTSSSVSSLCFFSSSRARHPADHDDVSIRYDNINVYSSAVQKSELVLGKRRGRSQGRVARERQEGKEVSERG